MTLFIEIYGRMMWLHQPRGCGNRAAIANLIAGERNDRRSRRADDVMFQRLAHAKPITYEQSCDGLRDFFQHVMHPEVKR